MSLTASLKIDPEVVTAPVNDRIFGTFVEHMGRCVYTGIFEPGHETATEDGFRGDVLDLTRALGIRAVRYPGGNFASGYRWEDGVGPRSSRPTRLDLAWGALEPNSFGLDEFQRWAHQVGAETILTLNLGTRGVQEALDLLEYVNHPGGTELSDLRIEHGGHDPYDITTWCLGNEMDGPWQLGHKTAEEYGRLAAETARAMRMLDPELELIVCGSSSADMPTFGMWEETVLRHTIELVDMVSTHAYFDPDSFDIDNYLASAAGLDRQIREVAAIADRVAEEVGSTKRLAVAVDEWNVWYMSRHQRRDHPGRWGEALRLAEDDFTVVDSVVVGSLLMSLLRNSERVGLACQAQLVNAIAPIRTEPDGPAWRQAIYHPFAITASHAAGNVLDAVLDAPPMETERFGEVPMVDAVVTHDPGRLESSVFAINRSTTDTGQLHLEIAAMAGYEVAQHLIISDPDLSATNTERDPNRVEATPGTSRREGRTIVVDLPPVSWSHLLLRKM